MSTALLTPDAEHLFNLCAFFSPEPIAGELLLENARAVGHPPGLSEFLASSARFRAAASQMHRLSLVKVDGARDQIQMHRVVQAVTRGQLQQRRPDSFLVYRAAADTLLAESKRFQRDDVLLAANGRPVATVDDLQRVLDRRQRRGRPDRRLGVDGDGQPVEAPVRQARRRG